MRITKNQLRQIIKEELAGVLDEETAIGDPTADMSNKLNLSQNMSKIQDAAVDKKTAQKTKDWAPIDKMFNDDAADRVTAQKAKDWAPVDAFFGADDEKQAKEVKESRRRKVRKARKR